MCVVYVVCVVWCVFSVHGVCVGYMYVCDMCVVYVVCVCVWCVVCGVCVVCVCLCGVCLYV
jgi:hypothetical protein